MKPRVSVSSGQGVAERLKKLRQKFDTNKEAAVGLPSGSGQHPTAGMSFVRLGSIHEFGAGSIPERSFLRVPLRAAQDELARDFKRLMPMVADGKLTMEQALNQIGARAAGLSQEAISAGIAPANTQATVDRKGSAKPLVDTGALRQAITWVVRDRGL